jgi:hypothetical protein
LTVLQTSTTRPGPSRRAGWIPSSNRRADLLSVLTLLIAPLVLFRDGLLGGALFYERDTYLFYYPLEHWVATQWHAGHWPLWLPTMFGGYPLFADGETGMLYPLNWPLLGLLSTAQAFIWRRVIHFALAGVGMFIFVRLLGTGALAGLLGGLSFSLGSFLVVQMHHENMIRSAVWLPLILAAVELALQRTGWARQRWLLAAGVVMGVAALGLHVQAIAMEGIALVLFTTYRLLIGPVPGSTRERLLLLLWAPGLVVGVGIWLAAMQWIPLVELGRATYRGSGLSYDAASGYAQSLQNLSTLVLPYLLRRPDATRWWAHWESWETHLYAGIVPLVFAGLGLLTVRRRPVGFFGLLAILALLISLAEGSPINVHRLLWQLPGFSSLRAPGRFGYLVLFGLAGLAAFGLDNLLRRGSGAARSRPPAWLGLSALLGGASIIAGVVALRAQLVAALDRGEEWLLVRELAARQGMSDLDHRRVYQELIATLDPLAPKTLLSVGLLIMTGLILLAWHWSAADRRRAGLWAGLLVCLTAADLLSFAADFHPKGRPETTFVLPPVGEYLAAHAAGQRVFASGPLRVLEPNQLVPPGVVDVSGYSSLPSQRHFDYWSSVARQDNALLDLWGVRYVAMPRIPSDVRIVAGTAFRSAGPLMSGPAGNPAGWDRFAIDPFDTTEVRVLASLGHATELEQDSPAAEIILQSPDGAEVILSLRAGVHLAEQAYDRPDVGPHVHHARPAVGATVTELDPTGAPYQANVYVASLRLPQPLRVSSVEIRHVHSKGTTNLWGLGLVAPEAGQVRSLFASDRAKYARVYDDDQAIVLENRQAFPRAFVVPEAVARRARGERSALERLALDPFDPRHTVILEDGLFEGLPLSESPQPDRGETGLPTEGMVLDVSPGHVQVRVEAPHEGYLVLTDSYHRGWRATIDGDPAPVYVADFLFRAVRLPLGAHTVDFIFEPVSVRLGAALSGAAVLFLLTVTCGLWARERGQNRQRGTV